jgi:hypothetical protein
MLERTHQLRISWHRNGKTSSAWISALPTPGRRVRNATYQSMWSIYLGTPDPTAAPLVALKSTFSYQKDHATVTKLLDPHCANITSATMPGDGWRRLHDSVKWTLAAMMQRFAIDHSVEVFGLISAHISSQIVDVNDEQHGMNKRARQGAVPDLRVTDPRPEHAGDHLYDVKSCNDCPTHYGRVQYHTSPGENCNAVKKRQAKVHKDYLDNARAIGSKYNQTPAGTTGPVTQVIGSFGRVRGLIFGAGGECSSDCIELLEFVSTVAAERTWTTTGYRNQKEAKACIRRNLLTALSFTIMRGIARLRHDRLGMIRGDASAAAKRRKNAKFNHERQRLWQQLSDGFASPRSFLPPF